MKRLASIIHIGALALGATCAYARPAADNPCGEVTGPCDFFEGPRTLVTRFGVLVVEQPDTQHSLSAKVSKNLDRWFQTDSDPLRAVLQDPPSPDTDAISNEASKPQVLAHHDPGNW